MSCELESYREWFLRGWKQPRFIITPDQYTEFSINMIETKFIVCAIESNCQPCKEAEKHVQWGKLKIHMKHHNVLLKYIWSLFVN